jgi:uncharacterized membrane protein
MALALTLHMLAVVIWVGGMFFAYMALRPVAAGLLEPPLRLTLWVRVFGRFFPWVWVAVGTLLISGFWMIFAVFGGFAALPVYIHVMLGLGILMMLLFLHIFFAPYRSLKRSVAREAWPDGGKALARIRRTVGINTILGLTVVVVAVAGRYW